MKNKEMNRKFFRIIIVIAVIVGSIIGLVVFCKCITKASEKKQILQYQEQRQVVEAYIKDIFKDCESRSTFAEEKYVKDRTVDTDFQEKMKEADSIQYDWKDTVVVKYELEDSFEYLTNNEKLDELWLYEIHAKSFLKNCYLKSAPEYGDFALTHGWQDFDGTYYFATSDVDFSVVISCMGNTYEKISYFWCRNGIRIEREYDGLSESGSSTDQEDHTYSYDYQKPSSSSSSSHSDYKYDPYDVYDYDDADDFADEWAEEFGDGDWDDGWDDAWDYYNEYR